MSNRDRLVEAGLIDAQQSLTGEQYEAIESLTTHEVDLLISVNEKLDEELESDQAVIEMPGRNPRPPGPSTSTSKGKSKS